jgi:hypothetical protein
MRSGGRFPDAGFDVSDCIFDGLSVGGLRGTRGPGGARVVDGAVERSSGVGGGALNSKRPGPQHDSTPPTKARWFDDTDSVDDVDDCGDNLLKRSPLPVVPETALSVQVFFERLTGGGPPRG